MQCGYVMVLAVEAESTREMCTSNEGFTMCMCMLNTIHDCTRSSTILRTTISCRTLRLCSHLNLSYKRGLYLYTSNAPPQYTVIIQQYKKTCRHLDLEHYAFY
jgi:hypothetical protein